MNKYLINEHLSHLFIGVPKKYIIGYFLLVTIDGILALLSVILLVPIIELVSVDINEGHQKKYYYENLIKIDDVSTGIILFLSVFILVNIVKSITEIFSQYIILRIKYSKSRNISLNILNSFLSANSEFIKQNDRGSLLNTINRECSKYADALGVTLEFLSALIIIIFYIIGPLIINTKITIFVMILILIISSPFIYFSKFANKYGKLARDSANHCMKSNYEIINYAPLIKNYGIVNNEINIYDNHLKSHISATITNNLLTKSISSFMQPMATIAAIISILLSYYLTNNYLMAGPILWSILRIYPLISRILSINFIFKTLLPSKEQVDKILTLCKLNEEKSGSIIIDEIHNIEISNLEFGHDNNIETIKDNSYSFSKGSIILVTGDSGVGKSTLLHTILGNLGIKKGSVKFNGINVSDLTKKSLINKVGILDQDIYFLNRSIRDNLILHKDIDISKLNDLLLKFKVNDLLTKLDNGIDTVVYENGSNLSGGERQRLAFIRLMLSNPDIIILDEPTSALDENNRNEIIDFLNKIKNNKIIFIVSHDNSFIEISDCVINLN